MLCKEALDEFKQIYLHEHGILLSEEETREKAMYVLNFVKLLAKDDPVEDEVGRDD